VTINRPKVLNALNAKTISELRSGSKTPAMIPRCAESSLQELETKSFAAARTSANGQRYAAHGGTENTVRPSAY